MENGWIKLHNKFSKWEWFQDSNMVHLWINLLLMANWEDRNWQGITIKRGQLVTGRKSLAKTLGLSERQIRTCLTRLKSTNEIAIKTTNRFSIITIINWDKYQFNDRKQPAERPTKSPTNDQQTTTPKDYKEDKKEHAEQAPPSSPFLLREELEKMRTDKRKHIRIIALFVVKRNIDLSSKEELSETIKRHSRAAVSVSKFEREKILKAVDECVQLEKEKGIKWTLETVLKTLTK